MAANPNPFHAGQTVFNTTLGKWQTLTEVTPRGNLKAIHNGRQRTVSPYSLMTQAEYAAKQAQDPETTCCVCGRDVNSHDVMTWTQLRVHLIAQGKDGFANGGKLVHYTEAQKTQKETQAPANTLETAVAVREAHCSVARWRAFEDKMYSEYPRAAWIVLCARLEESEGQHEKAAASVALFRREVGRERMAQREAWNDYRDAVEMQRAA